MLKFILIQCLLEMLKNVLSRSTNQVFVIFDARFENEVAIICATSKLILIGWKETKPQINLIYSTPKITRIFIILI